MQEPQLTAAAPFSDAEQWANPQDDHVEGPAVLPDDNTTPPHSFAWDQQYAGYLWTGTCCQLVYTL